ncbi:MAG: hypothetical protein HY454_00235 [Parcubacteria group bacterium]|nr:hypothetical protein [Parcubacteria group bacterium]
MDKLENLVKSVEKYSPSKYSVVLILPVFTLIAGFLVWSIYLYSLGFIENDLLRTRFILTGILFIAMTYIVYSLVKVIFRLVRKVAGRIISSFDSNNRKFLGYFLLLLLWLVIYSVLLFPKLPLVIGGGQPKAIALVANKDNISLLQSIDFILADGATHQTENICVAYEGADNLIILRENRIVSLDKSIINGFVSLPGKNAELEQGCIFLASQWSWKGFLSSIYLSISTIYNSFARLLNLPIAFLKIL